MGYGLWAMGYGLRVMGYFNWDNDIGFTALPSLSILTANLDERGIEVQAVQNLQYDACAVR